MGRRKTPEDYHALAGRRGFTWLGPDVTTVTAKTGWQCGQGHQWETTYSLINQGSGCPFCGSKGRKLPQDYHALARRRGFSWVGPAVKTTQFKTGWQCSQGHRWQARYKDIFRGKGCPGCARQRVELASILKHLTPETLARLAIELEAHAAKSNKVGIAYQKILNAGRKSSRDFEALVGRARMVKYE